MLAGRRGGEKGRSARAVNQAGDLWTRCTGSLRDQVSESTWQLWLSGIEPVAFADGVFILSVPNGLIRERVESRYLPMIEDTLANEVGAPVRGRLEVQEVASPVAVETAPDEVFGQPAEPQPQPEPASQAGSGASRPPSSSIRSSPSRPSSPPPRTGWPMRPPRPSPRRPAVPTTPCSSTATRVWERPTSSTPSGTTSRRTTPVGRSST